MSNDQVWPKELEPFALWVIELKARMDALAAEQDVGDDPEPDAGPEG